MLISGYGYFLEMLEEGSISVTAPLNIDAAISDPCFASVNGDTFMAGIRKIAGEIGMTITEMPRNQENTICCGYGASLMMVKYPVF